MNLETLPGEVFLPRSNHKKRHQRPEKRSRKPKARRGRNRHHLKNKVRGGTWDKGNILILKCYRHENWHHLAGNHSPEEVKRIFDELHDLFGDVTFAKASAILERMMRMKGYQP